MVSESCSMTEPSKLFTFENLDAYIAARDLVKAGYEFIALLPDKEEFGLKNQLRRSLISIPSNIAEGSGRFSIKEKVHFLEIAYGSLMESTCQIQLAADLGFVDSTQYNALREKIEHTAKLISGLRRYFKSQIPNP